MRSVKILAKYIVSYFLIVIVFVILVLVLYNTNYNTSKRVINTYVASSLENGLLNLEDIIMQVNTMSARFSADPNIVKLSNRDLPLSPQQYALVYTFINGFTSISNIHPSVDRLILTLPNGMVFCDDGLVHDSLYNFYGEFLEYDSMSAEEWLEKQETEFHFWEEMPVRVRSLRHEKYITYNCRYKLGSYPHLTALISRENLLKMLLPNDDNALLGVKITSGNETVFDNSGDAIGEASFDYVERYSEKLNLYVKIYIPNGFYADSISSLKGGLAVFTIIVILIGIVLSVMFALKQSAPVINLAQMMKNRGENDSPNPVDATISLLSRMDEDRVREELRTRELKKAFSSIEFEYLISSDQGSAYVPTELTLGDADSHYMLVLIRPDFTNSTQTGNLNPIVETIKDQTGVQKDVYILSNRDLILMYPCTQATKNDLSQAAKAVGEQLEPILFRWAVSSEFENITQLRFAYLEAEFALHNGRFRDNGIVFFDETSIQIGDPLLSLSYYNALDIGLSVNNKEKIMKFFDHLHADILEHGLATKEIRQITFIIRSILINHQAKSKNRDIKFFTVFQITSLPCEPPRIECIANIRDICLEMVEENTKSRRSHNEKLKSKIISLIDLHYHNSNLSLSWLADRLNTTPKYISNFISEQLGKSYTDYIQEVRLCKAADLLLTAELSVNQVAEQVGYMSSNAFYKGFRRYYDMSPSEYKAAMKGIADEAGDG